MKNIAIILALLLAPSCATLGKVLSLPGAVVSDVGDAVSVVIPDDPDPAAKAIGEAAGDAAGLITGNPLVDVGVTAAVGLLAGFFIRKKKKAAAA